MVVTAMYLEDFVWLQLLIFIYSSQLCSVYLSLSQPFNSNQQNFLEIFNENMVMVLGICCMFILAFGISVDDQTQFGNYLIGCLLFKLALNAFMILRTLLLVLKQSLTKCYYRCRNRKSMKEKSKKDRTQDIQLNGETPLKAVP